MNRKYFELLKAREECLQRGDEEAAKAPDCPKFPAVEFNNTAVALAGSSPSKFTGS